MKKQSSLVGAAGVGAGLHVLQNAVGAKYVKSHSFLKNTGKAFAAGLTGRVARDTKGLGRVRSAVHSAALGTAVPEAVVAQNHAYKAGQKVLARSRLAGHNPEKMTKRDVAKVRMAAEGRLPKRHQDALTARVDKALGGNKLPRRSIRAKDIKDVLSKPKGSKAPHSGKAVWLGNATTAVAEPTAGALNSFKHAIEHPKVANSALGKRLNKMLVKDPAKKAIADGQSGAKVSKLKDAGYKYIVNGPVGTGLQKLRDGARNL